MNKTLWDKFFNGKLAVNCRTENQAKKFLRYCEEQELIWCSGLKPTNGTCWHNGNQLYFCENKKLTQSDNIEFFHDIVTYKQLFKPEPEKKGLYGKYHITKADGSPCDANADYFVLRLDKDKHAREAVLAYANSVEAETPILAKDIRDKVKHYEETEYMTFDEARRTGKKFKYKEWEEFMTLSEFLKTKWINRSGINTNEWLDEKAWEVEK